MLDYEQIVKLKAKQIATGSLRAVTIGDGLILYRGRTIHRFNYVPSWYGGRYWVKGKHADGKVYKTNFTRLKDAKIYIDNLLLN